MGIFSPFKAWLTAARLAYKSESNSLFLINIIAIDFNRRHDVQAARCLSLKPLKLERQERLLGIPFPQSIKRFSQRHLPDRPTHTLSHLSVVFVLPSGQKCCKRLLGRARLVNLRRSRRGEINAKGYVSCSPPSKRAFSCCKSCQLRKVSIKPGSGTFGGSLS